MRAFALRVQHHWEKYGLLLILAGCGIAHARLAMYYRTAMIMRDESGYLANAAALAGYVFDGASSYRGGYSLLLAPAYLLFRDPLAIYRWVQVINLILALASIGILYALIRQMFAGEPKWKVLLGISVAAVYPAWMVFSSFAMSENVFIPVFVLAALCCLRVARQGGWLWIAWAACNGFLCIVHPRAIVVVAAALVVGSFLAAQRREWRWFLAHLGVVAVLVAFDALALEPWLIRRLTPGSFPPDLNYPSLSDMMQPLLSAERRVDLAARIGSHLAYLLMGSIWLAWFATLETVRRVNKDVRARVVNADTAAMAFIVLALLGTLFLSALHFSSYDSKQLDHWMYGRYVEGTLLPVLAIGFLTATGRAFIPGAIIAIFLTWVFSTTQHTLLINNFNVSALWQVFLIKSWPVVWWCAAAAAIGLVAYTLPSVMLRAMALASAFLLTAGLVYLDYLSLCYEIYARRHYISEYVRSHFGPATTCVGLEPVSDSRLTIDTLAKYGTHLFAYGLRRTTFDEWSATCNGPLISWSRDLDRRYPGIHLAAAELRNTLVPEEGPYLWTREPAPWFTVHAGEVIRFTTPSIRDTDQILGAGWYSIEPFGVWSSTRGELWLPLDDECAAGCDASLLFGVLHASEQDPVTVDVTVEGRRVAQWRVISDAPLWQTVPLENIPPQPSGIHIQLSVEGAKSPKDIGLSEDPRKLGIKVIELRVLPGRAQSHASSSGSAR